MRSVIVHLLGFIALFVVPFLFGQPCIFDKNDDNLSKKDPCGNIKLDPKRKYKTAEKSLELHVRFCQICEHNFDYKKDDLEDKTGNLTEACKSENGCSKRYIYHQGCPYTPPSDYFEPQCYFDDSEENLYKDPCTPYGDDNEPEEDPQDKWDPTHKYDVIKAPTISKKIMHANTCSRTHSSTSALRRTRALLCIIKGCTRRYLGWKVCPADADHARMQFSIDINSMAEVLKMLTNATLEFKYCVEHGGLCSDNKTNVIDGIERLNGTLNGTEVADDILQTIYRNCTAWDAWHH